MQHPGSDKLGEHYLPLDATERIAGLGRRASFIAPWWWVHTITWCARSPPSAPRTESGSHEASTVAPSAAAAGRRSAG